jgi:hypothetical protein
MPGAAATPARTMASASARVAVACSDTDEDPPRMAICVSKPSTIARPGGDFGPRMSLGTSSMP